jgi:hypothetical protein
MKKAIILLLILTLSAIFLVCQSKTEKEFVSLLNGTDLTGWYAKDGKIEAWQYADSMLSCMTEGGGWLTTEKEYENFVLLIDWRIPESGNSGVGIRYPKDGDPAHAGMEIQILDDNAEKYKDLIDEQYTGGIYYQVAAKRGETKLPGEWNHYEITCNGPQVQVKLNEVLIVDANLDSCTVAKGEHLPLNQRPRKGHVGIQSHGSRVDFRNIYIQEL